MAEVPKRVKVCEKILKNKLLKINIFIKAKDYLEKDFVLIGEMRVSKEYRFEVVKNLLIKCFIEINTKKLIRVI
jgi:Xanthine dehydrogenase, iron-sulfur cluster and FAD-binding subunit A